MKSFTGNIVKEYRTQLLVCGLGPAGISACVAAARDGIKVFAVERCAYAGGNITNANVIGVCGAVNMLTGDLVTGGITKEMLRRTGILRDPVDFNKQYYLSDIDMDNTRLYEPVSTGDYSRHPNGVSMIYDAELYKHEADDILKKSGVKFLYHTVICGVEMDGEDRIRSVVVANKDGLSRIYADMFIDATGDADIAAGSGAPFEILPDTMQAGTLMFVMGGVEYDDYAVLKNEIINTFLECDKRGEMGRYGGPGIGRLQKGVINFNMTRVKYNSTDTRETTDAEIQTRDDAFRYAALLKKYMPQFKNAYMLYSGPHLGARESRRIRGEYILTLDDIKQRKQFDDVIALGANPIGDFHDPNSNGESKDFKIMGCYEIPYRTLVPLKVNNLLVAGRCHSVTQKAAASTRVALTASLMGEAAGRAMSLAFKHNTDPRNINGVELHDELKAHGGIFNR